MDPVHALHEQGQGKWEVVHRLEWEVVHRLVRPSAAEVTTRQQRHRGSASRAADADNQAMIAWHRR